MKQLFLSLALLLGLFAATLWNTTQVTEISTEIADTLQQAEDAALQGDWKQATTLTQQAHQNWERWNLYFSVVLRHADTDDVATTFQEAQGFLLWKDQAEYTSANRVLVEKVRRLSKTEALSWRNLL